MPQDSAQPNIVFFHVDNLGMGELGAYGGGITRGAPTRRIDEFAGEGLQLWHYIAEPQCTPSRSALLTGRHSVRSGTYAVPDAGTTGGITGWERTIAEILHDEGYATAIHGKWHLGAEEGRWPTDHGFDQFYGPPRSYTDCMWPEDPWYRPDRDTVSYMIDGTRQDGVHERHDQQLTLDLRRDIDAEYSRRSIDFMRNSVEQDQPFFLYHNHSLMHIPTIPREEFRGLSGNGDWADCLLELDSDFGDLLDTIEELGIADNTIVIFAGDNGAEEQLPWRGSSGIFEGSYFTGSEGGLRTPCLIRWPDRVDSARASNEIVHQVDLFPSLLNWCGAKVPDDRVIDGIDQRAFFEGKQEHSEREGCIVWVRDRIHAVKWHDFKVVYVRQRYMRDEPQDISVPDVINLLVDPKEREANNTPLLHSWVPAHARRMIREFDETVEQEPLIPFGVPVNYRPERN